MPYIEVVRRLDDLASRAESACLAWLHAAIAVLVCAAVGFRYVANDPLTWSEELIILLFGWMIFLGIANAFRARTHIIIDVVVLFSPRLLRRAFGVASLLATFAVLGYLVHYSTIYMFREIPNETPMLGISAGWAIAPLVVGASLSLLHLLRNLLDEGVEGALWSDITNRE
jgi:TRAP-type C4-dicarboxylate transport system permease small subunit